MAQDGQSQYIPALVSACPQPLVLRKVTNGPARIQEESTWSPHLSLFRPLFWTFWTSFIQRSRLLNPVSTPHSQPTPHPLPLALSGGDTCFFLAGRKQKSPTPVVRGPPATRATPVPQGIAASLTSVPCYVLSLISPVRTFASTNIPPDPLYSGQRPVFLANTQYVDLLTPQMSRP